MSFGYILGVRLGKQIHDTLLRGVAWLRSHIDSDWFGVPDLALESRLPCSDRESRGDGSGEAVEKEVEARLKLEVKALVKEAEPWLEALLAVEKGAVKAVEKRAVKAVEKGAVKAVEKGSREGRGERSGESRGEREW